MRVEFRINIKRNFKALFSKVDRDWAKRNVNFVNLSMYSEESLRKIFSKFDKDKGTLESFNESRALEMLKTD